MPNKIAVEKDSGKRHRTPVQLSDFPIPNLSHQARVYPGPFCENPCPTWLFGFVGFSVSGVGASLGV